VVYVTDDVAECRGDTDWNDDSRTECLQCERSGKLAEFRAKAAAITDVRCEICDWRLTKSAKEGCVAGNCLYRPEQGSDEYRRIEGRRWEVASVSYIGLSIRFAGGKEGAA
jgi:hypothetical protein